jgi:hypothetical protein
LIKIQETILAKRELSGNTIFFPEVTASRFEVTFTYIQPLRITELAFFDSRPITEREQSLRFLAQPGHSYVVYYGADRYVGRIESETGDLMSDDGNVVMSSVPVVARNPLYLPADVDGDGVRDAFDNCVNDQNPDQADIDLNGRGDVCDDILQNSRCMTSDLCKDAYRIPGTDKF